MLSTPYWNQIYLWPNTNNVRRCGLTQVIVHFFAEQKEIQLSLFYARFITTRMWTAVRSVCLESTSLFTFCEWMKPKQRDEVFRLWCQSNITPGRMQSINALPIFYEQFQIQNCWALKARQFFNLGFSFWGTKMWIVNGGWFFVVTLRFCSMLLLIV